MKSKLYFSLVFGWVALTSIPAFAGETPDWVNEGNVQVGAASTVIGIAASGIALHKSTVLKEGLGEYQTLKGMSEQVERAQHAYQAEKAKLDQIVASSRERLKGSNVTSLDVAKQRKIFKLAEANYQRFQKSYSAHKLKSRITFNGVKDLEKGAERDLRRSNTYLLISKVGAALSIPVGLGSFAMDQMISQRATKPMTSGTSTGSPQQPGAATSVANQSAQ